LASFPYVPSGGSVAAEKSWENRLRREAARQGLRLEKSRKRNPKAAGFGTYRLVDAGSGAIVASKHGTGWGLSLREVERQLGRGVGFR
jgi:hypothetical protein